MQIFNVIDHPLSIPEPSLVLDIKHGSTLSELSKKLASDGILPANPLYLSLWARWQGKSHLIKSGEFTIPVGTTPRGLVEILISGKVIQHTLTLIEGWNIRQVRSVIESSSTLTQTLKGMSDAEVMTAMDLSKIHPEGQFLPDTYLFPKGTTDLEFLWRARNSMQQYLQKSWENRAADLPYQSPYDALIMASIIEKETGRADERSRIAGVFTYRLKKNMKLQTDPTVIYGIGPSFNGNLTRKDLRTDTPYNTYVHKGLPPTPIAMPGTDAIDAALHPLDENYIYFVAKGDGSHAFSKTLNEHNNAVRKYQLKK